MNLSKSVIVILSLLMFTSCVDKLIAPIATGDETGSKTNVGSGSSSDLLNNVTYSESEITNAVLKCKAVEFDNHNSEEVSIIVANTGEDKYKIYGAFKESYGLVQLSQEIDGKLYMHGDLLYEEQISAHLFFDDIFIEQEQGDTTGIVSVELNLDENTKSGFLDLVESQVNVKEYNNGNRLLINPVISRLYELYNCEYN